MLYHLEQPHVSLSDWQKFDREFSPLIGEVIGRSEAKLPDWLVPVAHGVFTASDALLRKAGHRDGMRRPRGWREAIGNDADGVYVRQSIRSICLISGGSWSGSVSFRACGWSSAGPKDGGIQAQMRSSSTNSGQRQSSLGAVRRRCGSPCFVTRSPQPGYTG
jgi:hypothetical protein